MLSHLLKPQQQQHLRTLEKCRFLGSTPDLLPQQSMFLQALLVILGQTKLWDSLHHRLILEKQREQNFYAGGLLMKCPKVNLVGKWGKASWLKSGHSLILWGSLQDQCILTWGKGIGLLGFLNHSSVIDWRGRVVFRYFCMR